MSRAAVLALTAVLLVVAGCGGNEEIDASRLPGLVLQPGDVPGFSQFDAGRQGLADLPSGQRSDEQRFGREGGWKARYRRPGSPSTRGPLVIESRADVFESGDGAEKELEAVAKELARSGEPVEAPELGDASVAATMTQQALADVRFYTIAWRWRNVAAMIVVQGFEGRLELDDAVELARKQQRRMERAAE